MYLLYALNEGVRASAGEVNEFLEALTINIQSFKCYHKDSQMGQLKIFNTALQKVPNKFLGSDGLFLVLGTM